MLCIDESSNPAALLALCYNMQSDGRLTTGFRSENLNDTALWNAANTQCHIQFQTAGRNRIYFHVCLVAQLHDSTFAELLFQ